MTALKTDSPGHFQFGKIVYNLFGRTHIMGILNVTPDSFSDGGKYSTPSAAVDRGMEMIDEGADFLDIGGESTRPGSDPVDLQEELRRVVPVIERLASKTAVPLSIDTTKSVVAERAIQAGAVLINDVSGLTADRAMTEVAARHKASLVIMHMRGRPRDMQQAPEYTDVVADIARFLSDQARSAAQAGIQQIIIDPGLGFGKTVAHNIALLRKLRTFRELGYPVLVGPSRKSFLGAILDLPVGERIEGTAAAVAFSIYNGASIVRVHDVREMKRIAVVADALKEEQ